MIVAQMDSTHLKEWLLAPPTTVCDAPLKKEKGKTENGHSALNREADDDAEFTESAPSGRKFWEVNHLFCFSYLRTSAPKAVSMLDLVRWWKSLSPCPATPTPHRPSQVQFWEPL